MTTHWAHVGASYLLVVSVFLFLAVQTFLRHAAAKRTLARLNPRGRRDA
jgi:hypothetical protein